MAPGVGIHAQHLELTRPAGVVVVFPAPLVPMVPRKREDSRGELREGGRARRYRSISTGTASPKEKRSVHTEVAASMIRNEP